MTLREIFEKEREEEMESARKRREAKQAKQADAQGSLRKESA